MVSRDPISNICNSRLQATKIALGNGDIAVSVGILAVAACETTIPTWFFWTRYA